MIKKYKKHFISLYAIQLNINDVYRIIGLIKKKKLGTIRLYDGNNNKVNLKKINKDIIYYLTIEVLARNEKDNFEIIFKKRDSSIIYNSEIDPDQLIYILEIERIINEKKVISIPKKISSNFQIISSLIFMTFLSLYPILKNINSIIPGLITLIILLLTFTVTFSDLEGDTRIIINIKNKFKRFYYKYYSITNLLTALLSGLIIITVLLVLNKYFKPGTLK